MPAINLVASCPRVTSPIAFRKIKPFQTLRLRWEHSGELMLFLLKVASLEAVRMISSKRCPLIWRSLQTLQILCSCPPIKWLQKWLPIGALIRGAENFSRPFLFHWAASALFDYYRNSRKTLKERDDAQILSESPRTDLPSDIGSSSELILSNDVASKNLWEQFRVQLDNEGFTLPKRIDHCELQRFHAAANGDFTSFLSSLKKTIRWRSNYNILSSEELEMWLHLVFWHGFDMLLRPCLVIRLGLACSTLKACDRPRFTQAIVSQIEHGVLHLVKGDDSRIAVLMDCEGLSPSSSPTHMMRSCSTLVLDHYPNRLGILFVVRLSPDARVLANSFLQILNEATRQRVHLAGGNFKEVLSEFLRTVPSFIGGDCTCSKCGMPLSSVQHLFEGNDSDGRDSSDEVDDDGKYGASQAGQQNLVNNCEHVLRVAIVSILMLWVFIALLADLW